MLEDIDAEQDPTKRRVMMDTLLASQGKNPSEHRYVKVGGGEVLGPDGFSKVKQAEGVFDTINQKFIPMNAAGAAPAAQAGAVGKVAVAGPTYASKAELQAAIKSGTVKPGQVVNTINGPFTVK